MVSVIDILQLLSKVVGYLNNVKDALRSRKAYYKDYKSLQSSYNLKISS